VGTGDDEGLVGVGVGLLAGGATGQVGAFVFMYTDCAGIAELAPSEEGTLVADAVPDAFGATLAWLGFASVTTGSAVDTHPALAVGCGPEVGDFAEAVAPGWLACPPPDAVAPAAGVPPSPLACVPPPSVPALPRGDPPPPLSEELAWRIAWRNG
jgi:hypothetical protein